MEKLMEKLRQDRTASKAGISLAEHLEDMKEKGDGLLILNMGDSRREFDLTPYIMKTYKNEVEKGLQILQEFSKAKEIKFITGVHSAVTREATAHYCVLDEKIIHCSTAKQEYLADSISYGYHGRPTLTVCAEDCRMIADLAENRPVRKIVACRQNEKISYCEIETGRPLKEVVDSLEDIRERKAYHIGNQLGRIISKGEIQNVMVEFSYLFDTLQVIKTDMCIVNEMKHYAQMAAEDSCQGCILCREGTWQAVKILQDACNSQGRMTDKKELEDMAAIATAGSMCQFGKQAFRPLLDALKLFTEDFEEHMEKHFCASGICKGAQNYQIDPMLCTGCTECASVCEYDAIDGKKNFIDVYKRQELAIDGEFQFDAAISPSTAEKKVKRESKVAGKANVVIWPDLNVGNTAVKLIQQFGHADAYGPMLQGFSKVVCDCSRGAPVSEIKGNIIISAVRAAGEKKNG